VRRSLIASLLFTARRKCGAETCDATPGAWTSARVKAHEAGSRDRADSSLASDARGGDCIAVLGDRHKGNDAAVQEIDLFDFIAGQMQELTLDDRDDLQMRLEQRKIPRPQRGQETIAVMLVLTWSHVGSTPAVCPTFHVGWFAAADQFWKSAVSNRSRAASLFDHLISAGEQRGWHLETERLRGLEVDHQLELGRVYDRPAQNGTSPRLDIKGHAAARPQRDTCDWVRPMPDNRSETKGVN